MQTFLRNQAEVQIVCPLPLLHPPPYTHIHIHTHNWHTELWKNINDKWFESAQFLQVSIWEYKGTEFLRAVLQCSQIISCVLCFDSDFDVIDPDLTPSNWFQRVNGKWSALLWCLWCGVTGTECTLQCLQLTQALQWNFQWIWLYFAIKDQHVMVIC